MIPEQKNINVDVYESYKCYQAIFEQAAVGITLLSIDGHWLDVNQKFCEIVGYSRTELLNLRFQDITHPDDLNHDLNYLKKIIDREINNYLSEKRYLRKDGSVIWVNLNLSLVRNALGNPEYFISVVQDIQLRKQAELLAKIEEQRYRAVIKTSIDGFILLNANNGSIIEVNDIYCQLSGYSRAELLNMKITDLEYNENANEVSAHIAKVIQNGGDVFNTQHRCKNGEIWQVEVTITYSDIENGLFFSFMRDVRQRYINRALLELHRNLAENIYHGSLRSLMEIALNTAEKLTNSKIGFLHFVEPDQTTVSLQIWSTNTHKTFCTINANGLHYPINEAGVWTDCIITKQPVIHNDYASLSHKKGFPKGHPPIIRELLIPIIRNNTISLIIGLGNKTVDYTQKDVALVEEIGDMLFEYMERKRIDDRIEFMAYYDILTSLPNRALLLDRLHQAIAQTKRFGNLFILAYLDLDDFKLLNDTYGHEFGDQILIAFSKRIIRALREIDTLARLGGDEFILIINGLTQIHEGELILKRLLSVLEYPFQIADQEVKLHASLGFTIYPVDQGDAETLLRHADQAMYQAKQFGKNQIYLYDIVHDLQLIADREMLNELRHAMLVDELFFYYQPKINFFTGEIIGVEALIRWNHPRRGFLRPDEFLNVLENGPEESTLLDKWVVRRALTQIAAWEANGEPISVSVNINPRQLCQLSFLDFIRAQAAQWPLSVMSRLEIELLESAAITDIEQLTKVMNGCAELGIHFALDDFGTGYSSLIHIRHLPIHWIKLDQKFVRGMLANPEDLKIVEGVARIARDFKYPIIAEGVETMELAALLIDLGCTIGQGYGIAKPMPAERLTEWRVAWYRDPLYQILRAIDLSNSYDAFIQIIINDILKWSAAILSVVNHQEKYECPNLCIDQCSVTCWCNGLGRFRYGNNPVFPFLAVRHRNLHLIAANLLEQSEQNLHQIANATLNKFNTQRDELIEMLKNLSIKKI